MTNTFQSSRVAYTLDGKCFVLQFGPKQFGIYAANCSPLRSATNGAGMRFRTFATVDAALDALAHINR